MNGVYEGIETFIIGDQGNTITCLRCRMKSWNLMDVAQLYCGYCHVSHFDIPPELRERWIAGETLPEVPTC